MKYARVLISVNVSSKHVARDENLANDAREIHAVFRVVFPLFLCQQFWIHLQNMAKFSVARLRNKKNRFDCSQIEKKSIKLVVCYFVLCPTNAQFFHKLSHSCMFRHCRFILRELVINTLPSYTSISNAAVGNTICN